MSIGRRETSNLRRRRLLVYQNSRDETAETAAERRQFEKLREARRPSEIYGTSVNRKLRGRWFSLVPVRRRAITAVAMVIVGMAALLCLGHWAAVAWQPLAYRPELARPLRLDRPDSFGAWVRAAYLAAAAGTSLLIYQLRRYRNDDFRGSYRIWPPVIVLMILASLDAVCQLVPWGGELIELMLGRRVALAGSDWIRIVLTVGGIALAMRMVAEVRHSKLAICTMVSAIVGFAIPMAARWGMLASDTPVRWLIVTSAPTMASAALWVACGAYLRKLFREVRKMEAEDRLSLRMQQWRERIATMRLAAKLDKEQAAESAKQTKAARKSAKTSAKRIEKSDAGSAAVTATVAKPANVASSDQDDRGEEQKRGKKSGFSLRFWRRSGAVDDNAKDRSDALKSGQAGQPAVKTVVAATPVAVAVRPVVATAQKVVVDGPDGGKSVDAAANTREAVKTKQGGLFGLFGKKKGTDDDGGKSLPKIAKKAASGTADGEDDDDDVGHGDDPSIDWASMGKAERRRLRREIKRGGQAA